MLNLINPISLSFIAAIMILALFLCFFSLYRSSKTYPGFREWVIATFFIGLGALFVSTRGTLPDVFSIVIGNSLVVISMLLMKRGISIFYEEPVNPLTDVAILLFFVFFQSYFTHYNNMHGRTINVSAAYTIIHSLMLLTLFRQRARNEIFVSNFLIGSLFFFISFNVIRACSNAYFLFFPVVGSGDIIFGLSMLFQIPSALLIYMSLIITNSQRVTKDLEKAIRQIKTLEGILPICCHCKMIRSESNSWQPVENYIKEHSNAEFTHGICPKCAKDLYPEIHTDS